MRIVCYTGYNNPTRRTGTGSIKRLCAVDWGSGCVFLSKSAWDCETSHRVSLLSDSPSLFLMSEPETDTVSSCGTELVQLLLLWFSLFVAVTRLAFRRFYINHKPPSVNACSGSNKTDKWVLSAVCWSFHLQSSASRVSKRYNTQSTLKLSRADGVTSSEEDEEDVSEFQEKAQTVNLKTSFTRSVQWGEKHNPPRRCSVYRRRLTAGRSWVLSGCSGFLRRPKDVQLWSLFKVKSRCECECVCWSCGKLVTCPQWVYPAFTLR